MNVPYNHPPRTLQFYLKFILWLLAGLCPVLIIVPIFTWQLPPIWIIGLTLVGFALLSLGFIKPLFFQYVLVEDVVVPRMIDISSQVLPPHEKIEPEIMWLELEGFERFGEFEQAVAGKDQPVTIWKFSKAGGKLMASVILAHDGNAVVEFMTYGTTGFVATYSAKGRSLKAARGHFSAVTGGLEAAFRYHISQVRTQKASLGSIIAVKSMAQFFKLDHHYAADDQVYLRRGLLYGVLSIFFLNVAITPGYLFLATRFSPFQLSDVMNLAGGTLYIGFILLVFGLTAGFLVGRLESGIDGKKFLINKRK